MMVSIAFRLILLVVFAFHRILAVNWRHSTSNVMDSSEPTKVFLLAGQSNMVGMASVAHLKLLIEGKSDGPDSPDQYQSLWNGTGMRERDDVYMQYNNRRGKLTAGTGFGAGTDHFGPELGFGWELGDALNDTIILIKSAYGGRSLAIDFRPPSSGEGNYPNVRPSHYGWEYRQMIQDFDDALSNLKDIYPDYDAKKGYIVAGFVWFQGWNDLLNWPTVNEYAYNLANFIRDVRLEVNVPDLPFIVGELGQAGMNPEGRGADKHIAMRQAQKNVTLLPEFRDTSRFVRTAPYVRANLTQYNFGFHYFGRADTYYHIGQAFGLAMLELIGVQGKRKGVGRTPKLKPNESFESIV